MNFSVTLEFILTLAVQIVFIVGFFTSLREKVKFLEADVIAIKKAIKEGQEQHKLIAKIDGKLDLLITQLSQK